MTNATIRISQQISRMSLEFYSDDQMPSEVSLTTHSKISIFSYIHIQLCHRHFNEGHVVEIM